MAFWSQNISESYSEWELRALEATGIQLSLLRFAISFVASVPVGLLFKFVPTVKGKRHEKHMMPFSWIKCITFTAMGIYSYPHRVSFTPAAQSSF